MATSRFDLARLRILVVVGFSLACVPRDGTPAAAVTEANVGEAKIQKLEIEHVTPRRDFVGPLPTRLEWTAVAGADSYAINVEDEIEIPVFDQEGITTTSVPWPKDVRPLPGTYFWRIVAIKDGRVIADSGRAAFVVKDQ